MNVSVTSAVTRNKSGNHFMSNVCFAGFPNIVIKFEIAVIRSTF